MSHRSDIYLSLCLEQAKKSSLHFRHGCIIVRGGKVIGQGYNTYRNGFDGGALKHGNDVGKMSRHQVELVIAEPKKLYHQKFQQKVKSKLDGEELSVLHQLLLNGKPDYEASKRTSRPFASRPRRAPAGSLVGSFPFKSRVLNPTHLNQIKKECKDGNEVQNEKDVWKRNGKKGVPNQHQNKAKGLYHHDALEPCVSPKLSPLSQSPSRLAVEAHDKPIKKSYNFPKNISLVPRTKPVLKASRKQLHTSRPSISARTQDLRLKGSDLYVARLGTGNEASNMCGHSTPTASPYPTPNAPPSPSPLRSRALQSLHDELSFSSTSSSPCPSTSPLIPPHKHPQPQIRASNPCYRCVSYMSAVGIKRAFWTNSAGKWEGARVRDLVDALDGIDGINDGRRGERALGVFVTKHEVLRLRSLDLGC